MFSQSFYIRSYKPFSLSSDDSANYLLFVVLLDVVAVVVDSEVAVVDAVVALYLNLTSFHRS